MYSPSSLSELRPEACAGQSSAVRSRRRPSLPSPREAFLHSPWKRSACDRCRSHKLKCQRENKHTNQSCIRCTRAGEVCFTSSAKTPGPPAKVRGDTRFASPIGPGVGIDVLDSVQLRNEAGTSVLAVHQPSRADVMTQESAFLMGWPFAAHQHQHGAELDLDFDVDMPSPVEGGRPASYFDLHLTEDEPFLSPVNRAPTGPSLHAATSFDSVDEITLEEDAGTLHSLQGHAHPITTSTAAATDHKEPGVLLAELQQELSRQHLALEGKRWDLASLSIMSSVEVGEIALGQESGFNPVASILASMSHFATILHESRKPRSDSLSTERPDHYQPRSEMGQMYSYRPESGSSRILGHHNVARASGPPTGVQTPAQKMQSRIHLLTTINCYLLVLTILDSIFSALLSEPHETTPQGPNDVSVPLSTNTPAPFPSLLRNAAEPGLVFAGHTVPLNSRLRTRLLVQVVEHQLETLEVDLGLPQFYCVSSTTRPGESNNKSSGDGVLSGREALSLLRAVMGVAVNASDHCGNELGSNRPLITSSLIDKLKGVQRAPTKHSFL